MTTTHKLFIVNTAGACVVAWAFFMGYAQALHEADASNMGYVLAAIFMAATTGAFWLAHGVDNWDKRKPVALRHNIISTAYLHLAGISLFILGVVGNAIGFRIAFTVLKNANVSDAAGLIEVIRELFPGLGTALGATIVGLTLGLWTIVNATIIGVEQEKLSK